MKQYAVFIKDDFQGRALACLDGAASETVETALDEAIGLYKINALLIALVEIDMQSGETKMLYNTKDLEAKVIALIEAREANDADIDTHIKSQSFTSSHYGLV